VSRKWSSSGVEAEESIRISIGEGKIRGGKVLRRLGVLDDEAFPEENIHRKAVPALAFSRV